jgi:hypothetical protein
MLMIEEIRKKFAAGLFEFSQHAVDQTILRRITVDEVREAIAVGEVIEDYPADKYGPSCFTASGRPLHVHCSHPVRHLVKIVTVYQPDPTEWVDHKQRKT